MQATGCAFNSRDIFNNFNIKRVKIPRCYSKGTTRRAVMAQVFRACITLVIEDVIEKDITFWLPLVGKNKGCIHMRRLCGRAFQKARQVGGYDDIDILTSNFSGFYIMLEMFGKDMPSEIRVYTSIARKKKISEYVNKGRQYSGGKGETKIKDYIPRVHELFPEISAADIKKILIFAWKSLYLHISYGGEVNIVGNHERFYFGKLRRQLLDIYKHYIQKLIVRIRVGYRRKGSPWDGYYYFALREDAYQHYLSQIKRMGRRKKIFNFGRVVLYQIRDECSLNESGKKYIFRVPFVAKLGLRITISDFTGRGELIQVREPLKFKDVMIFCNDYEYI